LAAFLEKDNGVIKALPVVAVRDFIVSSRFWCKYEFRHYNFPAIASNIVSIFRFRVLSANRKFKRLF